MGVSRQPDLHCDPFWHSCSDGAGASVLATPSSITWTQVSGLQPLVEPCLRQTLKLLPRPEMWQVLGPVPTACLLFLDAYYQAWSQQVSVACLPSSVPCMPASLFTYHPLSPSPFPLLRPYLRIPLFPTLCLFPPTFLPFSPLHIHWGCQGAVLMGTRDRQAAALSPWSLHALRTVGVRAASGSFLSPEGQKAEASKH